MTINVHSEYSSEMHDQRWQQQVVTAGGHSENPVKTRPKQSPVSCMSLCASQGAQSGHTKALPDSKYPLQLPVPSAQVFTDSCRL